MVFWVGGKTDLGFFRLGRYKIGEGEKKVYINGTFVFLKATKIKAMKHTLQHSSSF